MWAAKWSLGIMAVLACGERTQSVAHTVVDSAGVRVVMSRSPSAGASWVVDSTPMLRIAGSDDDSTAMLQVVIGAMRQSDGTIVVADNGAAQVKYYDARGRLVRTFGRRGRGPGEFEYLAWMWACGGDSAFVEDIAQDHVKVLAPDGHEVRRFRLGGPEGRGAFSTACNRAGRLVTTGWGDMRPTALGPRRPRVKVALSSSEGAATVQLGEFPGTEMLVREHDASPRPAGRWLRVAMGDTLAWLAPNEDSDIRGYASDGRLRVVIRRALRDQAFSPDDHAFVRQAMIDSARTERDKALVRRDLQLTALPEFPPPVAAMLADSDGNIWVRRHPRASDREPAWDVFDGRTGTWLATTRVPEGMQVLEIGRDHLLALRDDPAHGHEVLVLSLRR